MKFFGEHKCGLTISVGLVLRQLAKKAIIEFFSRWILHNKGLPRDLTGTRCLASELQSGHDAPAAGRCLSMDSTADWQLDHRAAGGAVTNWWHRQPMALLESLFMACQGMGPAGTGRRMSKSPVRVVKMKKICPREVGNYSIHFKSKYMTFSLLFRKRMTFYFSTCYFRLRSFWIMSYS